MNRLHWNKLHPEHTQNVRRSVTTNWWEHPKKIQSSQWTVKARFWVWGWHVLIWFWVCSHRILGCSHWDVPTLCAGFYWAG
jgi:hypothetical protein